MSLRGTARASTEHASLLTQMVEALRHDDVNEKCHVAFAVTPDGTGNATICAYVHKADGTLVGSGTSPYGSWTTSMIVQNAFMLGCGIFSNDNPQSSYDEVRVWKIALTKEQIEECIRLGPDTLPEYAYPPARGFMIFVE